MGCWEFRLGLIQGVGLTLFKAFRFQALGSRVFEFRMEGLDAWSAFGIQDFRVVGNSS